jgi:hypothetical protein
MRHRLLSLLATASLMLGLLTAGLWRRSYVTADWITYQKASPETVPYAHRRWSVLSARGYLTIGLESVRGVSSTDFENDQWLRNLHQLWAGLQVSHDKAGAPWVATDEGVVDEGVGSKPAVIVNCHSIPIRYAMILATSLVLPSVWIFRTIRRSNRRKRGFTMILPTPLLWIVASFLPLALASCTILPPDFPEIGFNVMAAAMDFYQQHGRWPESKEELGTGRGLHGKPLDTPKLNNMSFRRQADGSLDIFWTEGSGLSFRALFNLVYRHSHSGRSNLRSLPV